MAGSESSTADRAAWVRSCLANGMVIPASPLALTERREIDERRQRALWRYYAAAGAGGVAIGVHTTQFAIRDPKHNLLKPLLALAGEELGRIEGAGGRRFIRIAGVCGGTPQAIAEASLAKQFGFDAVLLSLGALRDDSDAEVLEHCRRVADIMPLFGFYLQPAVGGRRLSFSFWKQFVEIPNLVAIKIAPFNRYQTLDVVRAVAEVGRDDVVLYTGNDDNIVVDLLTPFRFGVGGKVVERRIAGGLLGQWAVWTSKAVQLLGECQRIAHAGGAIPCELLRLNVELTDANAAIFDAANGFAGCIPGIHEILRRQGLLLGNWCLDQSERLSPGQKEEIDRVCNSYPHLTDDNFVAKNLSEWLR